jgi:hypothetical protein
MTLSSGKPSFLPTRAAELFELNASQCLKTHHGVSAQLESTVRSVVQLVESRARNRYYERSMDILMKEGNAQLPDRVMADFSMYALVDNFHFWFRERLYTQTIERNELSSWIDHGSKSDKKFAGKSIVEEDIEEAVSKMPEINLDFKEGKVPVEDLELLENLESKTGTEELGNEGMQDLDQLREQNREIYKYQNLILNQKIPKKSSILVSSMKMLENTVRLLWGLSSQRQGDHLKSYDRC